MRKIVLLHFISLMTLQLAAQTKTVNIHGVVKDTAVKSIELIHVVDSNFSKWENTNVDVVNGAFNASIQVPFPVEINIKYGPRVYSKNFIYSDAEVLIGTEGKPRITGSPMQDEYENEFLSFFHANDGVYDSLMSFYGSNHEKYGKNFPKSTRDSTNLLIEKYYGQRAKLLEEYIKQHPNSYVALWDIAYLVNTAPSHQYFDFAKLFSSFSNQVQQQSFVHVLKEKIKESARMQAGQLFPTDFFKGHEQMQSKVRDNNQYYLIDFWYSHCGPCAKEFPRLKEIYNQLHAKGFDIVSISVDKLKDEKDYLAAIRKNGLDWNHVWDKDGVTAEKFTITSFPTYILLDKEGRIISYDIQIDQLEALLKEKLALQKP
jgi:thiol-disulfide isomerase/thioredoxin